jgi:ABC-2 type transport system permease protein
MSGLGALIGASARSPEEAGSLSLLLNLLMAGLGPVLVPADRLPAFMNVFGYFSPATYAASALRQTLLGPDGARLWFDVGVLLALSVVILWLVGRVLKWRQCQV